MRVFILAAIMAALSMPAWAGSEKTYGDVSAVILSNYDGDTLTVDIPEYPPVIGEGMKVRVRHVDTPEMKSGDPRAKQAKAMVAAMCPAGSVAMLRNVGRDMYFRLDVDVECGGKDVATELVRAGLAHGDYEGGTKEKW